MPSGFRSAIIYARVKPKPWRRTWLWEFWELAHPEKGLSFGKYWESTNPKKKDSVWGIFLELCHNGERLISGNLGNGATMDKDYALKMLGIAAP